MRLMALRVKNLPGAGNRGSGRGVVGVLVWSSVLRRFAALKIGEAFFDLLLRWDL